MSVKEGDDVPFSIFKLRVRNNVADERSEEAKQQGMCTAADLYDWADVSTEDLFNGKRCVLFALPGAFTPTCSSKHLPGYEKDYELIKSLGVDEIYCLSVNDAFVMREWGVRMGLDIDETPYSNGFKKVKLIPDGTLDFTRKMGMECVWSSERGFGSRSWRYSMVIANGKIEKLFEEQPRVMNSEADPFEVSDSETMVKYLKSL